MRVVVLLALAIALSGCTDEGALASDSVELTHEDVNINSNSRVLVSCGEAARLTITATAGEDGDFSVIVRGGGGYAVSSGDYPGNQDIDESKDLVASAGLWELRVDRSLEHDGTFSVKLTCL